MASLSNGTYWIVNASSISTRLDVSGGSAKDGANVQIWNANNGNAQVFRVQNASDGGKEMVSRYSGKAIDVKGGTLTAGTNVQQWKRNSTRAQSWVMVDSGSTVTIGGTSYATFYVRPKAAQTLSMQVAGSTSGSNVTVQTNGTGDNQKWAFVPVPSFVDGGVYELRSMLDTSMCAAIVSSSKADGANLILYSKTGSNGQKFAVYDEGNGYSIRCMASDKFLAVSGAASSLSNGMNVFQYSDTDSQSQRWSVTTYGTTTVEGSTCTVVEFGARNGSAYLIDVTGAKTTNSTNIEIYAANHTNAQKFALLPTDMQDPMLPVPANIRMVTGSDASLQDGGSDGFDVMWDVPSSWGGTGPSHFEHRMRQREMLPNGSWGEWGEWGEWETSFAEVSGGTATVSGMLSYAMDIDAAIASQWQVAVRSVTTDESGTYPANLHSVEANALLTVWCEPTVTFSGASWSPLGLSIPYSSDWELSSLSITSSSQLHESYRHVGDKDGTIAVPQESIDGAPAAGTSMALEYRSGTAQVSAFPARSATVTVSAASGSVTKTFTQTGHALSLAIQKASGASDDPRAWVMVDDMLVECEPVGGSFDIPYPMKRAYVIYAYDGSSVQRIERTEQAVLAGWSTGGVSYYAPLVEKGSSSRTIDQESETLMLDSRPESVVGFGPTRKTTITVTVRLYGLAGEMTSGQMRSLVGKHCLYRSPNGDLDWVSVDGIKETQPVTGVYDVDVSMTKETR